MRTAEEILKQHIHGFPDIKEGELYDSAGQHATYDVITAINEARKEALEEAAKAAHVTHYSERASDPWQVNKQSILSLIETLK
jgi:hypothetical protein